MIKLRSSLFPNLRGFFADPTGTTAIEYGIIAMILAVAIVGGVNTIGTEVMALFQRIIAIFP